MYHTHIHAYIHTVPLYVYSINNKAHDIKVQFEETSLFSYRGCVSRFLKISWRNLPNQVRIWASLHDNKYTNFSCVDNIENVGLLLDTLLSSTHPSSLYKGHSITKCLSSSIVLQLRHNLLFRGVLGFACLPRSISRIWELDRILVNAFRYLNSLTKSKYGSKWKSLFSSLYNSNLGCLFEFRSLERQPSTNFSFIVILISLVWKSGGSISQP